VAPAWGGAVPLGRRCTPLSAGYLRKHETPTNAPLFSGPPCLPSSRLSVSLFVSAPILLVHTSPAAVVGRAVIHCGASMPEPAASGSMQHAPRGSYTQPQHPFLTLMPPPLAWSTDPRPRQSPRIPLPSPSSPASRRSHHPSLSLSRVPRQWRSALRSFRVALGDRLPLNPFARPLDWGERFSHAPSRRHCTAPGTPPDSLPPYTGHFSPRPRPSRSPRPFPLGHSVPKAAAVVSHPIPTAAATK
jgi:hypothetical protein